MEGGGGLSSVATVSLAGHPPRYWGALDPIAFRCGSRETERQEKHEKEGGHGQGRRGDEGPAHRLASLVTDLTQSCGAESNRHLSSHDVGLRKTGAPSLGGWGL